MAAKKVLTNLLVAFALVSLGFFLGKESARRGPAGAGPTGAAASGPTTGQAGEKVIVYYMHQTFRCITCNRIEALTAQLIRDGFAEELGSGRLEWKQVNYQDNEALAERYNVSSSTVVVVRTRDGQETGYQRLDQVWTLTDRPQAFTEYVGAAIRAYLKGGA